MARNENLHFMMDSGKNKKKLGRNQGTPRGQFSSSSTVQI